MSPCVAPDNPNLNEGDDCVTGAPLNAAGTVGPAPDFDCIPNEGEECNVPETGEQGTIENGVCNPSNIATPTGPDGIKCEDGYPEGSLTFALQDQQTWWKGNCGEYCNDGTLRPESGVCEGEGGNGPDDKCPSGAEPFYRVFDEDKDGAFTDPRDGKSYTYDPCDQTQPPVEVPGPDDGNDESCAEGDELET